jgi:hypothetical protein
MKNENDELLEAALTLEEAWLDMAIPNDKVKRALETIERHRPKPRLVEGWAADYGYPYPTAMHCGETLERVEKLCPNAKRYIHVREVTDPPKWERWDQDMVAETWNKKPSWHNIADIHNAEMERFEKAWKGGE